MNNRSDFNKPRPAPGHPGPAGPEAPMSATEARQGRAGFPVLKVLIAALILLAIAWGVAEIWGQATEPPAEQTATPPAGDTTPGTQEAQPSANPADAPAPAPSTSAPAN
ncbi:hypothetical protein [Rhizobium halophilum]|uniref:hypothetical protein n=1 Tax=Rhizobium halophilum TaxID=2846852 RepID=UPI001EFCB6D2|nr:hypothetical protein [Rhizobium halophilum]MCF6369217.1 hypothetical protein [Rhizobium halophilum]